jgi:predicted PurR-regulated permease PerM
MSNQRVSVSISTLLAVPATIWLTFFLWQLRGLLLILMIAIVLAASISPVVNWAERFQVPRWLSVVIVYLALFAGLTGVGVLIGPAIAEQIELLIRQLPIYVERFRALYEDWINHLALTRPELVRGLFHPEALTTWVVRSSQQLILRSYSATAGLLGGVLSLVLAIFISGYMVADSKTLIKSLLRPFRQPWDTRLAAQVTPISHRMGSYIRGRTLVSLALSVVVAVGLSFLGLSEFALGLGAIAGVTNLIPFVGPVLGVVPALIVALSQGGWLVLWVLLLFVVVQNLETYVLDPFLVGSSVGLHPLYQLLAVLGGTQVMGLIGALIVPPWIAGAAVLIENLYLKPKLIEEKQEAAPVQSSPSPEAKTAANPIQFS